MPRMSVGMKLATGFGVSLLFLIIVGGIAYINTTEMLATRMLVRHTNEVLKAIGSIEIALLNAETGQRGFIVTGEDRFLEPYRAALQSLDQSVERVAGLTADNPNQQRRLQSLKASIKTNLDELAETIRLRRESGFDAALQVVRSGSDEDMGGIRAVLRDMVAEETVLLDERDAVAQSTAQVTLNSILYGTIVAAVVVLLIGFFIARSITGPVSAAVGNLASATAEILAAATQLASGSQEQAAAVTETVSTVDEVTQTSDQSAQRAKAVSEAAQRSVEVGKAGRRAVEESVGVMGRVKEQAESIAESILALAEQAQSISDIIASVNDIAEQTNLLALNAAIEASRAGEHGKGFGVVAGEVKALADQSKKATAQVRQILSDIQKATNSAVMRTEEGTRSVNEAILVVGKAGDTIKNLADTITEAAQLAAQISASAGQQATGMSQIHQAMKNINQVANQNLASTKQTERAAQDLDQLSTRLQLVLAGGR